MSIDTFTHGLRIYRSNSLNVLGLEHPHASAFADRITKNHGELATNERLVIETSTSLERRLNKPTKCSTEQRESLHLLPVDLYISPSIRSRNCMTQGPCTRCRDLVLVG